MKNTIIFGDSHIVSIYKGFEKLKNKRRVSCPISIRPLGNGKEFKTDFFKTEGRYVHITSDILNKNIARLPFDEPYDLYGFSGNLHTTRVLRDIDWTKHAPHIIADEEIPVTDSFLRQIFEDDQKYLLQFLDALSSLGVFIFAIEAPMPFRHAEQFTRARSDVLLYIDRMYREFTIRKLSERNIPVVRVPSELIDSEGFMLDIYRHENTRDPHHANSIYGEIMAHKIIQYVDSV